MLDLWVRPSASRADGHAALQTTVPMLVLPHDRLDAYAGRLNEAGLLLSVDLGPRSRALAGGLHTPLGLQHTPLLHKLYSEARASGSSPAWLFFCTPSICEPVVQRALSLYYFLWYEVVDDATELKSGVDSARAIRERRHRQGPSFIFMPPGANPFHRLVIRDPTQELRERRLHRIATTLAAFSEEFQFRIRTENVAAPLSEFRKGHKVWGLARKDPLVGTHRLLYKRVMMPSEHDALYTDLSRMERIARAVDAAAEERGTRVRADTDGNDDNGGVARADTDGNDDNEGVARAKPTDFLVPALHGRVQTVWSSPAARLVKCPLPLYLFYGGSDDHAGKHELELLKQCLEPGKEEHTSVASAVEHRGGVTADEFADAAVRVATEASTEGSVSSYLAKLSEQARRLGCKTAASGRLSDIADEVARKMYALQVADFLVSPASLAHSSSSSPLGSTDPQLPRSASDSDTSDEPAWMHRGEVTGAPYAHD